MFNSYFRLHEKLSGVFLALSGLFLVIVSLHILDPAFFDRHF
jgi:hypothetical protein